MSRESGSSRPLKLGVPAAWLGLAALFAAADLALKALVEARLATGQSIDFGVLTIRVGYNTGVAFSIGAGLPPWMVVVLTGAITTAVTVFLWLQASKRGHWLSLLGLSAVLGGAAGNFIDRLDGSGVVDYFHTGWFPTFNLADVLITLGVIALTLSTVMADSRSPAPHHAIENQDPKNPPSAHRPSEPT
ncbi:signal peptidase II [Arthrobacter subterraneus]|uniref:Lipoprotein signal peptidase n=1 Tax=Arthrobacter subterraneus TaxID=335973 RepID=A0A1G8NR11_9MICC|nr:signal peptidase II [Arthrobacter subterraneus]SDI82644.1 signal peptidase II [Arthrobacter subterraneus]